MTTDSAKQHVSVVISGHVDSGKSTTTGHLLFELGGISERDMQKLRDEAKILGKDSFCFAFFLDKQKDERERGITITCATKEFNTPKYHYTIIDAPGHRDFIKNMISGASQADVGVLMVPADGGFTTAIAKGNPKAAEIQGQTRQHAKLLFLLGIKQLIVCVNKMDSDTAKYSEERFNEVRDEMRNMLGQVGWNKQFIQDSVAILPISGWKGDNLTKPTENMPWWKGVDVRFGDKDSKPVHVTTLLDALDNIVIPKRSIEAPLRIPVSGIYNIKGIGTVITGRVEQGKVSPGDEVLFTPSYTPTNNCSGKVFTIEMHHKSVPFAGPGDNVGLNVKNLSKEAFPKVGDVIVLKSDTKAVRQIKSFEAQVQVLEHPGELKVGYSPIGFVRTAKAPVRIAKINWHMGKQTGGKKVENPNSIKAGDAASCDFECTIPMCVEEFSKCEGLGRLAILDGGTVVMLGKIVKVNYAE